METIIYQGQGIEVEHVAEKEGFMGARLDGQERYGSDKLLRDAAGCCYLHRIRYGPTRRASALGVLAIGLGAAWIALVVLPLGTQLTGGNRVIGYGLPCVALVYGASTLEKAGIRLPRFLSVIGKWSYSIYLSHVFVIAALFRLLPFARSLDRCAEAALSLGLIAAVILAEALSYHYLEASLLRITRQRSAVLP